MKYRKCTSRALGCGLVLGVVVSYPRSKLIPEVSWQLLRMLIGSDSSLKPVSSIAWSVIMA